MILMATTIILTTVTTIPTIPTIVSIIISFTFRKFSIVSPPKIPEVLKMITIHTLYKFRIHLQLLSVNCNNDAHKMPKAGIWALIRIAQCMRSPTGRIRHFRSKRHFSISPHTGLYEENFLGGSFNESRPRRLDWRNHETYEI